MQTLTDELYARYPGMTIWGKGDEDHADGVSDHNEDDTPGVRAAQSDSDSKQEHRAIDAKLSAGFTRAEAHKVIQDIITRERAKPTSQRKLRYINFETTQWHTRNNYAPAPNTNDPHPLHVHFSGEAAQDENTTQWLSTTGGDEVLKATRGMGSVTEPHDNVYNLQWKMSSFIGNDDPRLIAHPLTVDGIYGARTAWWVPVVMPGCPADEVNGAWFGVLDKLLTEKAVAEALSGHAANMPHNGTVPTHVTFTIPAQEITAQLVEEA